MLNAMSYLAADVGGTKTLLAVFCAKDGIPRAVRTARYDSAAFHGPVPMIRDFLARGSELVVRAGIGVAGPVSDGTCCATNLPWRLDERELADALGLERVALVNDFVAVALGILALGSDDLVVLQDGKIDPRGPMAILGAGTGLGEALLLRTDLGGKVKVLPTEGGHTAFAPSNEMEIR